MEQYHALHICDLIWAFSWELAATTLATWSTFQLWQTSSKLELVKTCSEL